MIIKYDGDQVHLILAPDEQRAFKLLDARMYVDDAFVHFSSFTWTKDGAEIFRTIRTLGRHLNEEPEYQTEHQRRRDDPPNLVRQVPFVKLRSRNG